jgi:tetratricopeptide (TPR) repeat protein
MRPNWPHLTPSHSVSDRRPWPPRRSQSHCIAWNNRCWDRALSGRLEDALADCDEALRLAPDDPGTLDCRGFTYLKLGRFEEAIADYDAALARNPRHPGSLYGRGLARRPLWRRRTAACPLELGGEIMPPAEFRTRMQCD